jgi:hypothetical protein
VGVGFAHVGHDEVQWGAEMGQSAQGGSAYLQALTRNVGRWESEFGSEIAAGTTAAQVAETAAVAGTSGVSTVFSIGAATLGGSFGTTAAIVGGIAGGAAGSLAGQLAGNAFGVQSGISWQGVLEGAVGGGIGGAFAASNVFGDLAPTLQAGLKVATANTLTQEVGIALHWQHGFDWASVGTAFVSASVAEAAKNALPSSMTAYRPAVQTVVSTLVHTDLANHGHFSWQNVGEQVAGQLLGQAIVDSAVMADAQRAQPGRAIRLDPIAPFVAPQMGTMVEATPLQAQSAQGAGAYVQSVARGVTAWENDLYSGYQSISATAATPVDQFIAQSGPVSNLADTLIAQNHGLVYSAGDVTNSYAAFGRRVTSEMIELPRYDTESNSWTSGALYRGVTFLGTPAAGTSNQGFWSGVGDELSSTFHGAINSIGSRVDNLGWVGGLTVTFAEAPMALPGMIGAVPTYGYDTANHLYHGDLYGAGRSATQFALTSTALAAQLAPVQTSTVLGRLTTPAAQFVSAGLARADGMVSDFAGGLRSLGAPDWNISLAPLRPGVLSANPLPFEFERIAGGAAGGLRPTPIFTPDGLQIPFGFKSEQEFLDFSRTLRAGLPEGVEPVFQGSSVTGVKAVASNGIPSRLVRNTPFLADYVLPPDFFGAGSTP